MARCDWFHNAVVYGLDVESFQDSDGDGFGDFAGLINRLDYLADLGVDALWLLPFYPTPNRDNGYDVADYRAIDPRLGTLDDFRRLVRAAESRNIRLIVDLVVNHTSCEHAWFCEARADVRSPYRDYYVWCAHPGPKANTDLTLKGEERETWTYDPVAGSHYFHLFYRQQPDLNWANPAVRREVERVVRFWLDEGAAGFRLDATPHIVAKLDVDHLRRTGTPNYDDARPEAVLGPLRRLIEKRRTDGVLLAEAEIRAAQMDAYLGGEGADMALDFLMANYVFLALARREAAPLADGLSQLPGRPIRGRLATFLRNVDELDLSRLDDAERAEVFAAFAPTKHARAFDRGIRRRLAPMLGGDARRVELALSLVFGLPGTPLVVYGDEIGMGDDLSLPGRKAVRTPMQWSAAANGGFSTAPRRKLLNPPVAHGRFGFRRVNIARQLDDPDSVLGRFRRLVRTRRAAPEIGRAPWRVVRVDNPAVLAVRYEDADGAVVVAANVGHRTARVRVPLDRAVGARDITCGRPIETCRDAIPLELPPYGHRWLRLDGPTRQAAPDNAPR